MHGVPERVLLRHLLTESGGSRSEAARRAGVGRSTMYRWIEAGLFDEPVEAIQARYHPRPSMPSQLDPYKPLIQARLSEFPALQAAPALRRVSRRRVSRRPHPAPRLRAHAPTSAATCPPTPRSQA